jgi:hypothetical protein
MAATDATLPEFDSHACSVFADLTLERAEVVATSKRRQLHEPHRRLALRARWLESYAWLL